MWKATGWVLEVSSVPATAALHAVFSQTATVSSGSQQPGNVPNASQEPASIGCAGSELCKKFRNDVNGELSEVSQDTSKKQSSGGRLPLPLSHAPKQAGNTRATCRCVVGRTLVNPPAHKRMICKYMLDVFGGAGFLAQTTDHLCLREYVLDTKFGPRYDVTKPLVLNRIRQDVSAGKCVAGMTTHFVPSQSFLSQTASPWSHALCSGTPVYLVAMGRAEEPCLSLSPGGFWCFWTDHRAGSERCFWLETWTTETCSSQVCWNR